MGDEAATTPTARRPGRASRRLGYVIAIAVNGLLVYLIEVSPGWQAVPFLTEETTQVIGLVTLSLWVGVVANLCYLVADPPWLRALGELVVTAVGVVVAVRLWQVFPFDLADPWSTVARVLLGIAIVGGSIGVVAQLVKLVRSLAGLPSHTAR